MGGVGNEKDLNDLLSEIKLMSYIKPHPNLVSMIGSCSSELTKEKKLWLLIEFCEHGDLQNYLKNNKTKILLTKAHSFYFRFKKNRSRMIDQYSNR